LQNKLRYLEELTRKILFGQKQLKEVSADSNPAILAKLRKDVDFAKKGCFKFKELYNLYCRG
jgi:hypothetical protein